MSHVSHTKNNPGHSKTKYLSAIFFTEGGGSSEESDVLSINADTYDSDIEGPKEEQTVKAVDGSVKAADSSRGRPDLVNPSPASQPAEAKKDIQSDIEKSVSEILALSSTSSKEAAEEVQGESSQATEVSSPRPSRAPTVSQPSIQQLELLELEMRARAIKALMKASDGKKPCLAKNVWHPLFMAVCWGFSNLSLQMKLISVSLFTPVRVPFRSYWFLHIGILNIYSCENEPLEPPAWPTLTEQIPPPPINNRCVQV